ncbi:MAG: rhomboid family intramembrane serine protease [Candidatus Pacearchaeota archaeon]
MRIRYYALWMCLICIIVFILQITIESFSELFVLNKNAIFEVWRFMTAIFLHGSLSHLIANLFALALFGSIFEAFVGSRKFLFVFFASGIFANIVSVNFYSSSLGASGAIYGILGALVVISPMMMVWVSGIPMPMAIAGIIWVAGGVFGLFYPNDVGHIAHLSGIAIGFIFGIFFRNWKKKEDIVKNVEMNEYFIRDWEDRNIRG